MTATRRSTDTRRRDFPQSKPRPRKANRTIKDGPKAQVNWDHLSNNDYLEGQHNFDDINAAITERVKREQLQQAIASGRESRERKIRRDLNLATEARWAVRSSWCPTCLNVFVNCTCPPPTMDDKVGPLGEQLIHRLRQADIDRSNEYKDIDKIKRRLAYRSAKRARRMKS